MSDNDNTNRLNQEKDEKQTHLFDKTTSTNISTKNLKEKEQHSIFSESSNDNENNISKNENKYNNSQINVSNKDNKNNSPSENNNFFNINSQENDNMNNISRSMSSKSPVGRSRSRSRSLSPPTPSKSASRSISPQQNFINNENPEINNLKDDNAEHNTFTKFIMKNGCCRECMKAFSKNGKSCLCQVPHKERKFQLPENGCVYCGCKGCNPIDVRYRERKQQKSLLFQDKTITHKNQRILDSDDEDLKIKEKDIDNYNLDKKELKEELEDVLKIHPIFYGYGVPMRTPSYILGYHTNSNNNDNKNRNINHYRRERDMKTYDRERGNGMISGNKFYRNNNHYSNNSNRGTNRMNNPRYKTNK